MTRALRRWSAAAIAGVLVTHLAGCAPRPTGLASPARAHVEPDLPGRRHVVAPGETLFRVAKTYGVSPEAVAAENGISDARALTAGQVLIIPESAERPESSATPGRLVANARLGQARVERQSAGDLQWPLRGVLYARFGRRGREAHDGIDLAAPVGTSVRTAATGKVIYAGEQKGYGLIAIIEHPNGLTTVYAHNHELRVKTGQEVREGQVIASVGESGRTTGPHLHFEVRREGIPVDPLTHLGPIPR